MFQCPPNMKAVFSELPGWSNLIVTAKTVLVRKKWDVWGLWASPGPQLPHIHPNRLPAGMEGERLQPLSLAHTSLAHSPEMISTLGPKMTLPRVQSHVILCPVLCPPHPSVLPFPSRTVGMERGNILQKWGGASGELRDRESKM